MVVRPVLAVPHLRGHGRGRGSRCATSPARRQRVSVTGTYGGKALRLGARRDPRAATGTLTGRLRVAQPQLWSPASPHLYAVHLTARAGGRKVGGYDLHSGIRSIKVVGGRLDAQRPAT